MRGFLIAAVLLALGAVAWWLSPDSHTARPPEPPSVAEDRPAPGRPAPLAADGRRPAEPARRPELPAPEPAPEATGEPPDRAAGDGRVHLEVWNRPTGEPLPGFRYVVTRPDGSRAADVVEGHAATLPFELDRPASVTIEAEGFQPSAPIAVRLTKRQPELRRKVWLEPAAAFTGIELWVQAPDQVPVRHLDVEAMAVDPADPSRTRTLWRRRAADDRGVYELPDIKPGIYRFRLQAVTETGEITTHVPHVETIRFDGGERFRRDVRLRAGGLIELEVTDLAGTPLGQEVNLRLVYPDGEAKPTRWTVLVDGKPLAREDGLPAAGRARLTEPVPPGVYVLQSRIGAGPVTETPITLQAGATPRYIVRLER